MIDVSSERLLSRREAAKHRVFARDGKALNLATLYRYFQRGSRGIRLEMIRTPAGKMTSEEAIIRFVERLSAPNAPTHGPTPGERQRQIARAEACAEAIGL